ncbi:MAG TPA: hypothetical protein PLX88_09695 [Syntrophorhabdaceae bacterium]|nr:hypothetical protein [Syntrophorhabdaceae bacterium]MDI9560642.1 hypothetical protein [Pseudomonadota bacterium]HOR57832.1 hypothetical protein [bacterium]HPN98841.1 hypothetical protein [Syntrophorhabdaceae bacterium]
MKKFAFLLVTIFCLSFSLDVFACDKEASRKVQTMLHELAVWSVKNNEVEFKWGQDWDNYTPQNKIDMITTFANSDACLAGNARTIKFYRKGKLVGEASPTWGIKLK